MSCFSTCECQCHRLPVNFDNILQQETRFTWTLQDICHSNIGWYTDKSISDHLLRDWQINKAFGVYVIWHKDDYCTEHGMFHMRGLYVGKGYIGKRLLAHWHKKDFSDEMLVYWSYLELPNRQSKYCEQLMLDVFCLSHNKAETCGQIQLCAHFYQDEVD